MWELTPIVAHPVAAKTAAATTAIVIPTWRCIIGILELSIEPSA
jgi:hypothetical protein